MSPPEFTAPEAEPSWPASERLAFDLAQRALASANSPRVLISSTSRGQAAARLASLLPAERPITLFEPEHFRWTLIHQRLGDQPNIRLVCASDPPSDEEYDLAVLAVRRDGGAELSRDLLQTFLARLSSRGTLVVVVDHPDDQWLGDQLRTMTKALKRYTMEAPDGGFGATGYVLRKADARIRPRDFTCHFAFRDRGRLIHAVSRPGVFSHRRLDLGARRLIDAMQVLDGQRVLDIGCGSGVVAFAAAMRGDDITVAAIDSSARAVSCTTEGAALNGLQDRVTAYLSSDGSVPMAEPFDVALANPPYFANFKIAELFLESAQRALRPGGKLWIVGKHPDWYQVNVPRFFDRVKVQTVGNGYCISSGLRPA